MSACLFPILMYHRVPDDTAKSRYDVPREMFEGQIGYLHANGFKTIVPKDLHKPEDSSDDNTKLIMISFDDGYNTDYSSVFPILSHFGFKSVHFVTTDYLNNTTRYHGYMSWEEAASLAKGGCSIQSHTHTHCFLSRMPDERVREELTRSKEAIKEKLDIDINSISLPGGRYDKRVVRLCKSLGYEYVFTSEPGINIAGKNQYLFYRMLITADTSFDEFKKQVNCCHYHYAIKRIDYRSKRFLKTVIGEERYHRIWERLLK